MAYRSPGVYLKEAAEGRFVRVEAVPMSVTAFLGLAQRGPVHVPCRLTSFAQFRDVYGAFLPHAYLAHAVFGYFANGGRECYVNRVAPLADGGDPAGATRAHLVLRARSGAELFALTASSEGSWGNGIKVQVGDPQRPTSTLAVADVPAGASAVRVRSTRGFAPGAVVELSDGGASQMMVLTGVSGDQLQWPAEQRTRVRFAATGPTRVTALEFRLVLVCDGQREEFDNLSTDARSERYAPRVVSATSRLVTLADRRPGLDVLDPPAPVSEFALAGGRDGLESLTVDDFVGFSEGPGRRGGLAALEAIDEIGLVVAPDIMAARELSARFTDAAVHAAQEALIAHCEARKDRFTILDAPPGGDLDRVREWRRRFDSKFAALYYPWVKVLVPGTTGTSSTVPPSGHVAGVYARCDRERGIHKAPANELLEEVVGLERALTLDAQGLLNHEHVNCLRVFPGRGIRIWGARTLSSDPAWRYVNVRRLVTMIERAVEEGTQWVVFESNEPTLWKQVIRSIAGFLRDLARRGYLVGATDDEAFYVKCDEETNPPEVIDAGQLVCEVGVAAVRPAEFIVFRIGQRTDEPIVE
jgi:hypothetical protein